MEQRIETLEHEVSAIKADIAVIKATYWTREDARHFDTRLARIEASVAELKAEVGRLITDLADLKSVVVRLPLEIEKTRTEMAHLATKAELLDLEARLKTRMIGTTISIITVTAATQVGLYTAFIR